MEDFQLGEDAAAALAEWSRTYFGGTLGATSRNAVKFAVMSTRTGDPSDIRLTVSEAGGKVSIEFLHGA